MPIVNHFEWDVIWFGVILTIMVAVGQFTPPLAVNLIGVLPYRQCADGVDHPLGIVVITRYVCLPYFWLSYSLASPPGYQQPLNAK